MCVATVRRSHATCTTWTEKSSLVSRALTKVENIFGLKPRKMLTPIKKRWEYLISPLQCLIENFAVIDYMYGPMVDIGANIKK